MTRPDESRFGVMLADALFGLLALVVTLAWAWMLGTFFLSWLAGWLGGAQ